MPQFNFPEEEEKILKFWQENKIFEKSLRDREKGPNFSFYDGPPFATGKPHYGTLLPSALKDTITRFYSQRGYLVRRNFGWDCHGLPVENLVEKELGIKSKKEIEKLGIDKFNAACRKAVTRHVDDFVTALTRFGRWGDYEHAYYTMDKNYSETVWWVFKQLNDAGLVYEDKRVSAYCPHCGTPLSNFEVNQGYKDISDRSIYILFKLKNEDNRYFLVWTTTPWTLSANLALAVGDFPYVEVEHEGKNLILARDRLKILKGDYKIIKELKTKDLIGIEYEPLYPQAIEFHSGGDKNNIYKVCKADFVTIEDGTGIVHIAPSFGEDDMRLGRENKLGMILSVDREGKSKTDPGKGLWVKDADKLVLNDLKDRGLLLREETIKHAYPFCWRCDSPLLYYPVKTYYVKVSVIVEKLVDNNQKIHWVPEYLKEGRFGKWLADARDWAISRNRYWGAPIPIWKCNECDYSETFGSVADLEKKSGQKIPDVHRPFIDQISYDCPKCKGRMKRTTEVFDCWFESGSMPYAQFHYPFENKEETEKNFPADFIAEGLDQTRGWFYTLNVLASALTVKDLGLGKDQPAFKNVVVNGIILAEDGKKLSKHLKNYPDPKQVFDNFGADALRFFLISSAPLGENYRMSERLIRLTYQNIVLRLYNSYQFLDYYKKLYGIEELDDFPASARARRDGSGSRKINFLDQWILEKLNSLYQEVIEQMEKYELVKAARAIDNFVADLSLWYIRRVKSQINSKEEATDRLPIFAKVLKDFSIIAAPFLPFLSEFLYQKLRTDKDHVSVHLELIKEKEKPNGEVLEKMKKIRESISKLLDQRMQAGLKVRQPLAAVILSFELNDEQAQIVKDELNVKTIKFAKGKLELDKKLTPELKEEGELREIVRNLQDIRKKNGYHFGEAAEFLIVKNKKIEDFLNKYPTELKKATNLEFLFLDEKDLQAKENIGSFKLDNQEFLVYRS